MRQYDDPVEVRRGEAEDPDQFLWRGRLWKVRAVVAHWVETGPWWQGASDGGPDGGSDGGSDGGRSRTITDVVAERELWRVEASRGQRFGSGVFELCFDWAALAGAGWTLVRALD